MNTAVKAQEADARLAFDNHNHAAKRHLDAVRKLLTEVQLSLHPDSVIIPANEIFERWVLPDQLLGNSAAVLRSLAVVTINGDFGVFYECGRRADGTYRNRGFRYGREGHEYLSGFGSTGI